ncbi:ankyrin repeat domain-containing protein [Litchfieldia alkalitelluris]|uniref:ankyrin repeat domain-containing protein n=1 Tax=Litchfieldia alkalitelluris TaxID=304268 RepID=UPI0009964F2A|nr:ankyrin repeat domain-containing protein [Litchfieldia alkalitelluris]
MSMTQIIDEIFQAAKENDFVRLKQLLEENPNLANTENSDGLAPLGFAAHYGNADVVKVLIDYGANINAISHSKISYIPSNTALHAAIAGERNIEVIKLLLTNGADTTIFDSNGHTALHSAAFHDDNVEVLKLLLNHGVEVNAKLDDGVTALELAVEKGYERVVEVLRENGAQ